jgi:hypothetical protein
VRLAVATLGLVLGCVAIVNAQEPQVQPTPGTADAPPERTLKLNLNDLLELQQERGHAEFDTALRRELWKDPMIRLAIGISREQAATARGGLVGVPRAMVGSQLAGDDAWGRTPPGPRGAVRVRLARPDNRGEDRASHRRGRVPGPDRGDPFLASLIAPPVTAVRPNRPHGRCSQRRFGSAPSSFPA